MKRMKRMNTNLFQCLVRSAGVSRWLHYIRNADESDSSFGLVNSETVSSINVRSTNEANQVNEHEFIFSAWFVVPGFRVGCIT